MLFTNYEFFLENKTQQNDKFHGFYDNFCYKCISISGPRDNTLVDFWRMIWEQSVNAIFMLTLVKEKSKVIFHYYGTMPTTWPPGGSKILEGGGREHSDLILKPLRFRRVVLYC